MSNCLVVSEGKNPELLILEHVFKALGFRFEACEKDTDFSNAFRQYFDTTYVIGQNEDDVVYFVHLKNPRAEKLLKDLKGENNKSLPELISNQAHFFKATFLLHDVDHYYVDSLQDIGKICYAPEVGQLVLSIPCIEAINDTMDEHEGSYALPSAYQNEVSASIKEEPSKYFMEHTKELLLYHLNKNAKRFDDNLFIVHQDELSNSLDEFYHIDEEADKLVYSYFTSLVYIVLGVVKDLHIQDDSVHNLCDLINTIF